MINLEKLEAVKTWMNLANRSLILNILVIENNLIA